MGAGCIGFERGIKYTSDVDRLDATAIFRSITRVKFWRDGRGGVKINGVFCRLDVEVPLRVGRCSRLICRGRLLIFHCLGIIGLSGFFIVIDSGIFLHGQCAFF